MCSTKTIASIIFSKFISLIFYRKHPAAILQSSLLVLGSLLEFLNESQQVQSCHDRIVPQYTHGSLLPRQEKYLGFSQGCDFVMETVLPTSKTANICNFLLGRRRIKLIPKLKMLNGIPRLASGLQNGVCHVRKFITQSLFIAQAVL